MTANPSAPAETPAEDRSSTAATEPRPDLGAALDFLHRLRPEGPWVLSAKRPDGGRMETATFGATELQALRAWLEERAPRCNLYYSVNPTIGAMSRKASRADISALEWLHVDLDPRVGEDLAQEQERLRRLLTGNPPKEVPPPTAVVFSGGGYQALWRLREPLAVDGDLERAEEAKLWNLALEHALGGDHCHNIDRVLRLPGTVNWPDKKKRARGRRAALAELVSFHEERVYDLQQMPKAPAPAGPRAEAGAAPSVAIDTTQVQRLGSIDDLDEWCVSDRVKALCLRGDLRNVEGPKSGDDSRSAWLMDAVCQLVRAEVPDDIIYSVITDPDFAISASVLDKGSLTERYARKQIAKAKELTAVSSERGNFLAGALADDAGSEEWTPPAIVSPFPIDRATLPMRPWVVPGFFLRGHLTLITGRGGAGKSTVAIHQACSVATGEAWAGWEPTAPGRVLILQAEDDEDEQSRRVLAACDALGLDDGALRDRLLFLRRTRDTYLVTREEPGKAPGRTKLYHHLLEVCREERVALLIVDPLVEMHAGLDENSNVDMSVVASALRGLARGCNMAVAAVHHNRKSSSPGDQDGARGASALVNAARIVVTLTPMSEEEAKGMLPTDRQDDRRRFTRVTGAKNNYDLRQGEQWIEMRSLWLRNAGDEEGDAAPSLRPWQPAPEQIDLERLLRLIEQGPSGDGRRRYTVTRVGPRDSRGDALLEEVFGVPRGQGSQRLRELIERGVLVAQSYRDEERRVERTGLFTWRELERPEPREAQAEIPF